MGDSSIDMLVLHATWSDGALRLWGERSETGKDPTGSVEGAVRGVHPAAATPDDLAASIARLIPGSTPPPVSTIRVMLPTWHGAPVPSPKLAHWTGHVAHEHGDTNGNGAAKSLAEWSVAAIAIEPVDAPGVLDRLEEHAAHTQEGLIDEESGHEAHHATHMVVGESLRFYAAAARFA